MHLKPVVCSLCLCRQLNCVVILIVSGQRDVGDGLFWNTTRVVGSDSRQVFADKELLVGQKDKRFMWRLIYPCRNLHYYHCLGSEFGSQCKSQIFKHYRNKTNDIIIRYKNTSFTLIVFSLRILQQREEAQQQMKKCCNTVGRNQIKTATACSNRGTWWILEQHRERQEINNDEYV